MSDLTNPVNPSATGRSTGGLEYIKSFKFLFSDANWGMNWLLGALLMIIPIVGPIVAMGWQLKAFQRLVKRHPQPIPRFDFSDFGFYLGKGVIPFLVSLLIMLPSIFVIWLIIMLGMVILGILGSQGLPEPLLIFGALFTFVLVFAVGFVPLVIFTNAAITRAYLTEDFGKAFQLRAIMAYAKTTWSQLLKAYVVFFPMALKLGYLSESEFDEIVQPAKMTHP